MYWPYPWRFRKIHCRVGPNGPFSISPPIPWRGQRVLVRLRARDGAGQVGLSDTFWTYLPERRFTHPIAKKLVKLRNYLSAKPSVRHEVARELDRLTWKPQDFGDLKVVFLALRVARLRLLESPQPHKDVGLVREILWESALHIEEGALSFAARALAKLQQDMESALKNGDDTQNLDDFLDRMERGLASLFDALDRALPDPNGEKLHFQSDFNAVSQQEINRLIDRARQLAALGQMEAARAVLAQLQKLIAAMQLPKEPKKGLTVKKANALMKRLEELTRRQQHLLDETFRVHKPDDRNSTAPLAPLAKKQSELKEALNALSDDLKKSLGASPKEWRHAKDAMDRAGAALRRNQGAPAMQNQGQALESLRQGGSAAANGLARALGGMGRSKGQPGQGVGPDRDPLGRSSDGSFGASDTGKTQIGGDADQGEKALHRAREILEDLRRRLGDPDLPKRDRLYIERLLKRF